MLDILSYSQNYLDHLIHFLFTSVQGVWQETIPTGGEMTMTLMRRAQGSTLVQPAPPLEPHGPLEKDEGALDTLLSMSENKRSTLFSKLLTANPQEVYKYYLSITYLKTYFF